MHSSVLLPTHKTEPSRREARWRVGGPARHHLPAGAADEPVTAAGRQEPVGRVEVAVDCPAVELRLPECFLNEAFPNNCSEIPEAPFRNGGCFELSRDKCQTI